MGTSIKTDSHVAKAMEAMRAPSDMSVICIDITNKCDLSCSNCTRLLKNQDEFWDMSPENFRTAVRSLADFPGTIAVIGGNPPMHRNFEEICRIIAEEIPDKKRRGLWTNNVFKHTELAMETFGTFNLNTHGNDRAIKSLAPLRELSPNDYYEKHSIHTPLLTAIKDIYPEDEMWRLISKCDVNQCWSAGINENNGKPRAYFCEVAAAFDVARGTDHGLEVTPDWWKRDISDFEDQIRHFCPGCGVPAMVKGHLDSDETDSYTASNADLAEKSLRKNRKVVKLEPREITFERYFKATEYGEDKRSSIKQTKVVKNMLKRVVKPAIRRLLRMS